MPIQGAFNSLQAERAAGVCVVLVPCWPCRDNTYQVDCCFRVMYQHGMNFCRAAGLVVLCGWYAERGQSVGGCLPLAQQL